MIAKISAVIIDFWNEHRIRPEWRSETSHLAGMGVSSDILRRLAQHRRNASSHSTERLPEVRNIELKALGNPEFQIAVRRALADRKSREAAITFAYLSAGNDVAIPDKLKFVRLEFLSLGYSVSTRISLSLCSTNPQRCSRTSS
jgi:hypothetical protein